MIVAKLATMHAREPALTHDDLARITCRTLVMIADDDEVRLEHAVDLYRSLPDAELAVVPGTSHGLLVEKPELCNTVITEFFTKDPIQTFAPIRRAAPPVTDRLPRLARKKITGLPAGFRFTTYGTISASLLIVSGADVKTVQARLRHASVKTTLDTYGHIWPDRDESARAAVDAVITARQAEQRRNSTTASL